MDIIINDPICNLFGAWSAEINMFSILLRIAISVVFSAVIGCERASKRHAAGLRTFILVSLASTIAVLLDLCISGSLQLPLLSAAAVIGIAVISSNTILYSSKSQIKGLTTSVGLWACGIAGLTAGAGLYTLALITFVTFLCILSILPALEKYLKDRSNHFEIQLELRERSNLQDFVTTIRRLGLVIDDIESNPAYHNSGLSVYTVSLTINSRELRKYKRHDEIIEALRSLEYIAFIDELT
ncbi:MAG: MgtC/SapB family protein [Oscillospiraceae bacterium]|nr:MgtC/SapB family protein [Oscillospiraceae bacterium]